MAFFPQAVIPLLKTNQHRIFLRKLQILLEITVIPGDLKPVRITFP